MAGGIVRVKLECRLQGTSSAVRRRVGARGVAWWRAAAPAWLAVLLLASAAAEAQQTVTLATVRGIVEDPSGGVIQGASVTATSGERGQAWRTQTDAQGRYRFLFLPVGGYELRVEHPQFSPVAVTLTLTVGQALDVPVRLSLAGGTETVEVTHEGPMLEAARTQISETITPVEIDNLPLNGRNYLDLAALAPGVSRANPVANQRFPETSAVPGSGLSITGQRHFANGFVVDGLSSNDDAADLAGTFYSQEVIREFQVITSGGIAEFGRATGGTVNILTQSGSNDWRGRAYGFMRDESLDAKNPLAKQKDPLSQWQYGASVSGPLARGRSFLFANLEQTRLDNSSVITISEANVATINRRLDATGYPGPRVATGTFRTGYDITNLLARVDHRLNDSLLLMARYNLYDLSSPNARNVGGLNAESRGTALANTDHTLAANLVATISPSTVNETRLQYTRSRLAAPPNDLQGPAINISGTASFGTATFSPTERALDLYELVNTTTLQRGAHAMKAGVDLLWNRLDIVFPGAVQGVYTFSSLPNFLIGRYVTYQRAFGAESQFQSNANLGLFVQDEWRVNRELTLNLGLRYDLQDLPDPIQTDGDNISPRLGIAWAPGAGRTVFRASYGLFYDRIPLRATSNALQRDGSKYRVAVVPFGTPGAPAFPNALPGFPDGLLASITTIDSDIHSARSQQISVQVERELGANTSLGLGYLRNAGFGLIVSRNVNVPTLSAAQAAAQGVPNLGRPDPNWANVSRYGSLGESEYNGMTFSLRHRFSRSLGGRVAYTLSKAMDDVGNAFFFTPQDSADIKGDWGRADNDQRHLVRVSGSAEVPRAAADASTLRKLVQDFQLSGVFAYGSALPFNVLTGTDRNNDTNVNDRPVGVARNSGEGFDTSTLDLRLSRKFRLGTHAGLEAIVEAFNVLNHANYLLPNNVYGPLPEPRAGFGSPTAAADARQIQLGLRMEF